MEDLLRGVLLLHFDDVPPEIRTPSYSSDNRVDLFLVPPGAVIVMKWARPDLREPQLAKQWAEDVAYYRKRGGCRALVGLVYDPELLLVDSEALEAAGSRDSMEELETCIVTAR